MSTKLLLDPRFDKQAVFQLLVKFDLSAGDIADVFASYLTIRPAKDFDLESLRGALKKRGTASQIEVVKSAGRLLTSEEICEQLGLAWLPGSQCTISSSKENCSPLRANDPEGPKSDSLSELIGK